MSAQLVDNTAISADQTISRVVEALIGYHRLKGAARTALLGALAMSADTLARRLDCSKSWTASEVATLAAFFGVEVGDLYSGRVDLPNSGVYPDVRISRNIETAGQAPFSGSDIDHFLDAVELPVPQPRTAAVA